MKASPNLYKFWLLLFIASVQRCRSKKFVRWIGRSAVAKVASLAVITGLTSTPFCTVADSRLNAPSAAGTRVNSDAYSLLRNGLPINSKEVREIQKAIEEIKANIKTRRISNAKGNVQETRGLVTKYQDTILKQVEPQGRKAAQESFQQILDNLAPLSASLDAELKAGAGSMQEEAGQEMALRIQGQLSQQISRLEERMVPSSFKRQIPAEYAALPALQGRATVEMTIKKPDGGQYAVEGKLYDKVTLKMVIDGYNAPITGGNFVDLVKAGFYNGKKITRSDGFVVQTGDADPGGAVHGYVPKGSTEERKIPLEIAIKGDKDLLYSSDTEETGRGSAATVLPFQSFGALGMARSEFENDSASSQFFWLLFESNLTPAGKNILDGRYACFGYTTEGAELLPGVKEGDIIESAVVVQE